MTASPSRKRYYIGAFLALLLVAVIAARLYLGVWLLDYVNNVLGNIQGYQGSVASIDVDLYRGAYRINQLKINKKEGGIPAPFIAIDETDISIQWAALLHGRVVSNISFTRPVINFAVNKSAKQTGGEVDWTRPIKDLTPIDINHVTFENGKLSYQDFSSTPKVDIYINNMRGEISNLRNVTDDSQPLPSVVEVKGSSIGNGKLAISGRMNILKPIPDMDLLMQLEEVSLPALSNYSDAYAAFDFKSGEFSVYSEFIVKDSRVSGYVKPIARHIAIVDLRKTSNPIKIAWESLVASIIEVLTNHSKDQFATKIKLEGDLSNINTDKWSAIAGIFHNAFISALQQGLDKNGQSEVLQNAK